MNILCFRFGLEKKRGVTRELDLPLLCVVLYVPGSKFLVQVAILVTDQGYKGVLSGCEEVGYKMIGGAGRKSFCG